jgi:hypothetical protein
VWSGLDASKEGRNPSSQKPDVARLWRLSGKPITASTAEQDNKGDSDNLFLHRFSTPTSTIKALRFENRLMRPLQNSLQNIAQWSC